MKVINNFTARNYPKMFKSLEFRHVWKHRAFSILLKLSHRVQKLLEMFRFGLKRRFKCFEQTINK